MAYSRPQLSLNDLEQLRWLLGGLIGIVSAWTVFYMEVDALLALLVLTVAVPLFTLRPALAGALPPLFHRLAFPVIVTVFAMDWWMNREPLPAMIRLDLMLLGYRCVSPRGRREDMQLILLALFVVVVTGVFTVSPAFVLQILLFTGASLGLLLAITLSDARSSETRAAGAAPRVPGDARLLALGGGLFLGVVALSALLFMALPRFEISNSFFLDRLIKKTTRTGFSEEVRFGELNDIAQDGGMAFAFDVQDPSALPTEPYWRMLVLDEYTGEGFRMSPGMARTLIPTREKTSLHTGVGRNEDSRAEWTIYLQPGISRYLPLLGGFGRLSFAEPQALNQSTPLRIAALQNDPPKMVSYRIEGMDTGGLLRDPIFARYGQITPGDDLYLGRRGRRAREAREDAALVPAAEQQNQATEATQDGALASAEPVASEADTPDTAAAPTVQLGDAGSSASWSGESIQSRPTTFLDFGPLGEAERAQLTSWAKELGGAGSSAQDFAERAADWLHRKHSYSLNSRTPPGDGDVILRWMGSEEPGHCELFAGSFVLLSRAAGRPARMVTGFKGGVYNATSGGIRVLNSDAHAWVELWDPEARGWLRVDPTPGASITPPPPGENVSDSLINRLQSDSGWTARIDGLKIFWYRRIVDFDQDSQRDLLRGTKDQAREAMRELRERLERGLQAIVAWVRSPWDFSRVAVIVGLGGAMVGVIVFWKKFGRAWWLSWLSHRAASHRHDPVRREASRWLLRLERAQSLHPSGAPKAAPEASVEEARARLLRLRYGARESWDAPTAVFAAAKRAHRKLRRG
jgi:protein-glutamine gamma-glutamyltransferase